MLQVKWGMPAVASPGLKEVKDHWQFMLLFCMRSIM